MHNILLYYMYYYYYYYYYFVVVATAHTQHFTFCPALLLDIYPGYLCTCVCTHIHIYIIHTYIHTYIQHSTYIQTSKQTTRMCHRHEYAHTGVHYYFFASISFSPPHKLRISVTMTEAPTSMHVSSMSKSAR